MENKKINNPVFESLTQQVRRFKPVPQFSIYEQADEASDMTTKEVTKYFNDILILLEMNIVRFIQSIPQQDLKDEVMPTAMEGIMKLGENASTTDLITALNDIWDKALGKIKGTKYKGDIGDIYDKAGEGIAKVLAAHKTLKEKSGGKINDPKVLESANNTMKNIIKGIQDSIQTAKNTIKTA